jgi:hypothetical protein
MTQLKKYVYAAAIVAAFALLSIIFFRLFGLRSASGLALAMLLGWLVGRLIP